MLLKLTNEKSRDSIEQATKHSDQDADIVFASWQPPQDKQKRDNQDADVVFVTWQSPQDKQKRDDKDADIVFVDWQGDGDGEGPRSA